MSGSTSIFKKMVLVSPAGLKPEQGQTWDYFVISGKEAFEQAFHDPRQSLECDQYYGNDWTPEMEDQ